MPNLTKYLLLSLLTARAFGATKECSVITHCRVAKRAFEKAEWKTANEKTFEFKNACRGESASFNFEPELGISLSILSAASGSPGSESPKIHLDIFSYKPTFVVASAETEIQAESIKLTHRLTPRGNSVVEVFCRKRE